MLGLKSTKSPPQSIPAPRINKLGSKQAWVTLQRPPPEIFTLAKGFLAVSNNVTLAPFSLAAIAPKKPAAPPPITITLKGLVSKVGKLFLSHFHIYQYTPRTPSLG
jgi:hypothetical protein